MSASPVETAEIPAAAERGAWSIAALAGLACGIFLIVPFIAGIAAIALGVMGLRETREPSARGRRIAIAAILLGIVNVVGWGVYAEFIGRISAPGRSVARHFFTDLDSGNAANAERDCTDGVGETKLQAAADQIKSWGGAKSVAVLYIESSRANGAANGIVRGSIHTAGGDHSFQLETVGQDGVWKVDDFLIR